MEKYVYAENDREYIVQIVGLPKSGSDEALVKFIGRVGGGRGRMPKPRTIKVNKLVHLTAGVKVATATS